MHDRRLLLPELPDRRHSAYPSNGTICVIPGHIKNIFAKIYVFCLS